MHKFYNLLIGEFKMAWYEMKRYWFNTIMGLVWMFLLMLMMFLGINSIGGAAVSVTTKESFFLGFILFGFAASAYSQIAGLIIEEASKGTLEQLYMSPLGIKNIFVFKLISSLFYSLLFMVIFTVLAMLFSGYWLNIKLVYSLPLLLVSLTSLWGLGFIFAGLALVFKKMQSIFGLIQFVLIPMAGIPCFPFNFASILPYAPGANTIMQIVVHGKNFSDYPLWWYGYIFLNSLVWLIAGVLVFNKIEKQALKKGTLGHY